MILSALILIDVVEVVHVGVDLTDEAVDFVRDVARDVIAETDLDADAGELVVIGAATCGTLEADVE